MRSFTEVALAVVTPGIGNHVAVGRIRATVAVLRSTLRKMLLLQGHRQKRLHGIDALGGYWSVVSGRQMACPVATRRPRA